MIPLILEKCYRFRILTLEETYSCLFNAEVRCPFRLSVIKSEPSMFRSALRFREMSRLKYLANFSPFAIGREMRFTTGGNGES